MYMLIRRGLGAAVAAVALTTTMLSASAAFALESPTLSVNRVVITTRTVDFDVAYSVGTGEIALFVNSAEATRTSVDPAVAGHARLSVDVADGDVLQARAYDSVTSDEAASNDVTFTAAPYLPGAPKAVYINNHLVSKVSAIPIIVGPRTAYVRYRFNLGDWFEVTATPNGLGQMRLPATPMRYRVNSLEFAGANAWGTSVSRVRQLQYLGSIPTSTRFVLVDKSELNLYYVDHRALVRVYPIAIGMWDTPTPNGYFTLGVPMRSPSSAWGPFRMPLMKGSRGRYRLTSYYIHGTNDPDSIGTMASHGCIRMYNWQLRDLRNRLRRRLTTTLIRG
jgi:lipoprotein-anchoring transpeptidase ErfK/SrfK